MAVALAGCARKQAPKETPQATQQQEKKETTTMNVREITSEEFKAKVMNYEKNPQEWVFEGDKPAIVDFYATWCPPCKATAPHLEKIAEKYAGKIDVYKVNVDNEEEVAAAFGIRSIPTLLFIPQKGDPTMQVGGMGFGDLDKLATEILN